MKPKIKRWFILYINMLLFSYPVYSYNVIQFYHRVVEDALPSVQALLQAGESATTIDNKLVLNVSAQRAQVLVPLIQSLDQKQASLIIEVEQGGQKNRQNTGLGARARLDGIDIQNGQWNVNGRVTVDGYTNQTSKQNTTQQTLRLLSGTEGYIELNPRQYREDDLRHQTGFTVRPRLVGQNVVIDLSIQNTDQTVVSTVEGPLGQWIDVAGFEQSGTKERLVLFGLGHHNRSVAAYVRIKVTLTPN